jgi:preprotein translocase subunit YajC
MPADPLGRKVVLNLFLQQSAPGGMTGGLLIEVVLLVGIMYWLLLRPMQKQRKDEQKMLSSLQNGNTVITKGGMIGTIVAIESDDTLVLRVKPDNVKIQVTRASVASLLAGDSKKS